MSGTDNHTGSFFAVVTNNGDQYSIIFELIDMNSGFSGIARLFVFSRTNDFTKPTASALFNVYNQYLLHEKFLL
jgi:hypothetical protein